MNQTSLLATLERYSPYLWRLQARHPHIIGDFLAHGAHATLAELNAAFAEALNSTHTQASLMQLLRAQKGRLALLTAIADISETFTLKEVTETLSHFADACVNAALGFLLKTAETRGEVTLPPEQRTGIIIIGMGKLGAFELNYSSDIDLIVLFEKGCLNVRGRQSEQAFMNRLAHDLVFIMQERTADSYVFRTDLRLRPDPSSTPPAVSIPAAMTYYESVGQNWERAAMIKARAIAGDPEVAAAFLKYLTPFMWRRTLDFAAIQDILSIKRQMDHREGESPAWLGFNVKLGKGGIREMEFFVQIHQLIWGGRHLHLRKRATLEALQVMVEMKLVDAAQAQALTHAYVFLRTLEHRLQMVDDQQTHSLPATPEALAQIAEFMGFANVASFEDLLELHTNTVHTLFADSFKSKELSGEDGNLVFTGVTHDPSTLKSLREMGYAQPETVSEIIMDWHHGNRRATRTKRSREVLTELVPAILKAFAKSPKPDESFLHFDSFVAALPAGMQLFSLFISNPRLLDLLARVMSHSPYLKEHLLKYPELIEAVLMGGFYDALPTKPQLEEQLAATLQTADDFEESMAALRRFKNEKQFQAGVQFLSKMCSPTECGAFLSHVADAVVSGALTAVEAEFERSYGRIPKSGFAILGLGRLGSENMTFSSDIDAVFIYDAEDFDVPSTGEKSYTAGVYFNRLSQRVLTALTTVTEHGILYEVDTRLRPSGKQGLLSVSFKAFSHYFAESAWTFEDMALTRARVVAGTPALAAKITTEVESILRSPRDPQQLIKHVLDMRKRTLEEFPATSIWDLKYTRGGLMDADFIAQYLVLRYASEHPSLLKRETGAILTEAERLKIFTSPASGGHTRGEPSSLVDAYAWMSRLFHWLRLSATDVDDLGHAGANLKTMIIDGMELESFELLENTLIAVEKDIHEAYSSTVHP